MSHLFEEYKIGSVTLKNRVAMAPMGHVHAADGGVSEQQHAYILERAKGGFGLIYPSAHTVTDKYEKPEGSGNFLFNYSQAARLAHLVDEVHQYGAKFAIQLTPGYGRVNKGNPAQTIHVSASDNRAFYYPDVVCHTLTVDEIHELVACMGKSAALAKMAGVDIIEIHAYGGYLIDQFMSKVWNRRDDEYGGSLDNRMRFFNECTQAVRRAVGPDFPISVKYTPVHEIEGGRTFEDEGIEIARRLQDMDFAYMHVDYGCYERWNLAIPSAYEKQGAQLHVAERLRKEGITMPFLIQGKLNDPVEAERVIESGLTDMIALGKQSLADPYWPSKVKNGRVDDIDFCCACLECLNHSYPFIRRSSCAINPRTAAEREYKLEKTAHPRKLLVVGGGPGGMAAAKYAAQVGHSVELWEKSDRLGGNMNAAGGPDFKFDVRRFSMNLQKQLYNSGAVVRLSKEANADSIKEFAPDAVIVAAGAKPIKPRIPGIDNSKVIDALDLLSNRIPTGEKVYVLGGGEVGCEAAAYLDSVGKDVTIIEMQSEILSTANMADNARKGLEDLLGRTKVRILTGTKLTEIKDNLIVCENDTETQELAYDNLVLAVGFKSDHTLCDELKSAGIKVFPIGDYNSPRKIYYGIHEGFHVIRLLDDLMEI